MQTAWKNHKGMPDIHHAQRELICQWVHTVLLLLWPVPTTLASTASSPTKKDSEGGDAAGEMQCASVLLCTQGAADSSHHHHQHQQSSTGKDIERCTLVEPKCGTNFVDAAAPAAVAVVTGDKLAPQ